MLCRQNVSGQQIVSLDCTHGHAYLGLHSSAEPGSSVCTQLSVHGAGAKSSPWLSAVSPTLPSHLIGLLSKDGADHAVDTWCWQALYLLQAQLSASQMDQILQHPAAQRVSITPVLQRSRSQLCFLVGQQGCRACRNLNECYEVLCCAVLCCAVMCLTVLCCVALCCYVPHRAAQHSLADAAFW